MPSKMYGKPQVFFISLAPNEFVAVVMNALSSSKVLWSLLVNFLFRVAHISSAGFSSGLYGGKNIRPILSGTLKVFALWNAPLSSTITLNSPGSRAENPSRKTWKLSALQLGISNRKLSPFMGENAPKR